MRDADYPDDWDIFFDPHDDLAIQERHLPHWRQEGKIYFVTWRQGDSLSQKHQEELKRDRKAWIDVHGEPPYRGKDLHLRRNYYRLFHVRVQQLLDAGYGSCVLQHLVPRCIVRDALKHFDGVRYHLGSFAIASNHVHVLVLPRKGIELSEILHSWKSFTANEINKALDRKGMLWKAESYDHLVRHEGSYRRIENYILRHAEQGAYVERRSLV